MWAVRSAEMLMREVLLMPHFMAQGKSWDAARHHAIEVMGGSAQRWRRAFDLMADWYNLDPALTEDNADAWAVWRTDLVRRRGDLVHGRMVPDATAAEAAEAINFVWQMVRWYAMRLMGKDHPVGVQLREMLDGARTVYQREQQSDSDR